MELSSSGTLLLVVRYLRNLGQSSCAGNNAHYKNTTLAPYRPQPRPQLPYKVGRCPGEQTRPRSNSLESNCVTQMPTLSPCMAFCTGVRYICMDRTFLVTLSAGISIDCGIKQKQQKMTTNYANMHRRCLVGQNGCRRYDSPHASPHLRTDNSERGIKDK